MECNEKIKLFGLHFDSVTLDQAASDVIEAARYRCKGLIVTPNVDHVVQMDSDKEMRDVYEKAMSRYVDGMPLVWLSWLIYGRRKGLPERITGNDLVPAVVKLAADYGMSIYVLGGNPGVAEKTASRWVEKYNGLKVAGTYCPPFGFEKNPEETEKIISDINDRDVDILFVGVGAPKQEKWSSTNLSRLNVGPVLCIGAALNFEAGIQKRAPDFMQRMGLEWLWRLTQEPRRLWRRYLLRDSRFIILALREILRSKYH